MPGQAARSHQHQVESRVKPGKIRARQKEGLGGAGDASPLAWW